MYQKVKQRNYFIIRKHEIKYLVRKSWVIKVQYMNQSTQKSMKSLSASSLCCSSSILSHGGSIVPVIPHFQKWIFIGFVLKIMLWEKHHGFPQKIQISTNVSNIQYMTSPLSNKQKHSWYNTLSFDTIRLLRHDHESRV